MATVVVSEGSVNGSAQSLVDAAQTHTVAAGDALVAWVWWDAGLGSVTPTISDTVGGNSAGWVPVAAGGGDHGLGSLRAFYRLNGAAGSSKFRASYDSPVNYPAITVAQVSDVKTALALIDASFLSQTSPGNTTDAITSGATATTAAVRSVAIGMNYQVSGTRTPAVGTGFTSAGTGWTFEGSQAVSMRVSSKEVATTVPVAATATNAVDGASTNFQSAVIVLEMNASGGGGGSGDPALAAAIAAQVCIQNAPAR